MIDKQKIQQAANNYIGHEPEIDEGCNVSTRREAFKDGVDWFKKNIWHSCQEEPEKGEFIVTEFFKYRNAMRLIAHHGLKIGKNIVTAIILWHGAMYQIYCHRLNNIALI